ncbi:MAG: GNAT family N-acetyltransferase [Oscillospiraceae bacterium]|nr:GNAT family N-acetyltransferase [Oscillospiraceae bacterium]
MSVLKIEIGESAELCAIADELRKKVFIDEQGVPEDEAFDGLNGQSHHAVVFYDGAAVATARLLRTDNRWQIGLVAVVQSKRGQNLGEKIMGAAIDFIASNGGDEIFLTAQQQVCGFYKKLGFEQSGELTVFESGFVLVPMKRILHRNGAREPS